LTFALTAAIGLPHAGCERKSPTPVAPANPTVVSGIGTAAAPKAAGLKTDAMDYHAAEQRAANWCWAACVQMLLSARGVRATQPEIVAAAFGDVVDAPADPVTIALNVNRWRLPAAAGGRRARLNATVGVGPPPAGLLVDCLSRGQPVIAGYASDVPAAPGSAADAGESDEVGHAIVITGVVYVNDPTQAGRGGPRVLSVLARDPDPAYRATAGKRKLTAAQFARVGVYFLVGEVDDTEPAAAAVPARR
jgi:hypothetical protein